MIAAAALPAALLCWALAIVLVDWHQRRVPNVLLLALFVPAVAMLAWQGDGILQIGWPASLLGCLVALVVTLPGHLLSKFGAGDVKLAAVMGFVQGWPSIAHSLLIAGLLMGLVAVGMVLASGFANVRSVRLPTAWALLAGFAAVVIRQAGEWQ